MLNYLENAQDAQTLSQENPVNKIPILIEGDQKIFDSRVIVNHLIEKNNLKRLTLDEENLVTAIYGAADTSVSLFLLSREGLSMNENGWYLQRQKQRIHQCLEYVAPWMEELSVTEKDDWNYASMSLYSYLYWVQARNLLNLNDFPRHIDFLNRFQSARGLQDTGF